MRVTLYANRLEELRSDPAHVELTLRKVREAIAYLEQSRLDLDKDRARVLREWDRRRMERAITAMDGARWSTK